MVSWNAAASWLPTWSSSRTSHSLARSPPTCSACVNHLLGPLADHEVFELANDAVSPLWRSFGRDAPGHAGVYRDLTIGICPPSLERLKVPSGKVLYLRPTPLPTAPATSSSR